MVIRGNTALISWAALHARMHGGGVGWVVWRDMRIPHTPPLAAAPPVPNPSHPSTPPPARRNLPCPRCCSPAGCVDAARFPATTPCSTPRGSNHVMCCRVGGRNLATSPHSSGGQHGMSGCMVVGGGLHLAMHFGPGLSHAQAVGRGACVQPASLHTVRSQHLPPSPQAVVLLAEGPGRRRRARRRSGARHQELGTAELAAAVVELELSVTRPMSLNSAAKPARPLGAVGGWCRQQHGGVLWGMVWW